jgi:5-methylthioadenosine/S-adenosylhomocysteine deaminase
MTLMRGLADDLPLMSWLQDHIWPTEGEVMGAEMVADGVTLAPRPNCSAAAPPACNENYFFPKCGRDLQACRPACRWSVCR